MICACQPVSIHVTVKKGKRILTCRHCGQTMTQLTKANGSFLQDKPKYKEPWKKGKHGNPNRRKKRL